MMTSWRVSLGRMHPLDARLHAMGHQGSSVCGFAGVFVGQLPSRSELEDQLQRMGDAIFHRGPDDGAAWVGARHGVALIHRRLSILDLSAEGRQPMVSASGRYRIAFNGEIYNFEAIRAEIPNPPRWRGGSDTEVLLAAIEAWGIEGAVERCVGMFAFAVMDRQSGTVTLVRDRVGIKPLFFGRASDGWVFGSELGALRQWAGLSDALNMGALAAFFRYGHVPAPHSILRDVQKVMPGQIVTLSSPTECARRDYWKATEVFQRAQQRPFSGDYEDAVDAVESLLADAVKQRMIADVPLGAFLSGGIDSSTVVALMQSQSDRPVKTFSIGNQVAAYDESAGAAAVADHLGTEHHALVVGDADALALVDEVGSFYDEPFGDSSQLPTYLVSRLARSEVTVGLSGDGGDELFGGYNRHVYGPQMWRRFQRMPSSVRRVSGAVVQRLASRVGELPGVDALPVRLPEQKAAKLGRLLKVSTPDAFYMDLVSHWQDPLSVVRSAAEAQPGYVPLGDDMAKGMMRNDFLSYLTDDILTKVDRASMAVSLEARVPILDHRVVELAWSLPLAFCIEGTIGKRVLRSVLGRHVPEALWDRPKMGFSIPLDEWLRGPLRPWAEAHLEHGRRHHSELYDTAVVDALWSRHQQGSVNAANQLWQVLMFADWQARRSGTQGRSDGLPITWE